MGGQAGRLAGKVALITGAASGIGRATAALFHGQGAKVAATDRNEPGLKTLGADADLTLAQDVTDEARWRAVVDEVLAAFGRLDILVNSAGIAILGNIETTTLADWRKVNAVNAEGVFLGCREAVRAMKETGGGSIVNLSSVAGIIGDGSSLAYCASKGAVRLMTKSAALHCARAGYKIRVNSVHPSFAETPMVLEGIARAKDPDGFAQASSGPRRWAVWGRRKKSPTPSCSWRATNPRSPPAGNSWSTANSRRSNPFAVTETAVNPTERSDLRRKPMSETNKDIAVALYKKALFEGQVEEAFRLYAGVPYRQHNPLIEDGVEGVKKFAAWVMANHPDAHCEIKRVFADGDHVILHSIGMACPTIRAERRWWTSFGWKAARSSSTGT